MLLNKITFAPFPKKIVGSLLTVTRISYGSLLHDIAFFN